MTEQKGIEGLKKVVDLGLTLVDIGTSAMKDGKIDAADLGQLMKLVPVIEPAVSNFGEVIPELKDLSTDEAIELVAYVSGKLMIENAKARLIVEKALKAAVAAFELVKAITAPVPAPAAA